MIRRKSTKLNPMLPTTLPAPQEIFELQSRAEVRAIFLNVDKPLAEKSPRPGHSRVTAIHQNTRGLPSFEGYKVPLYKGYHYSQPASKQASSKQQQAAASSSKQQQAAGKQQQASSRQAAASKQQASSKQAATSVCPLERMNK